MQCHDGLHASHDGQARGNPAGLFAPNDNDLCFTCHSAPSPSDIFPGSAFWNPTVHARSSYADKCVNCHDPHGVKDNDGVIPALLVKRDSDLCDTCHNGSRAADIAREFTKPYRHPIGARGSRHLPGESTPASFAAIPANNRHAECSDCHNAHLIDTSSASPTAPQASNRLAGVSRIEVANGAAGLAPTFVWRGPGEPGAKEYEICFKCHSSFTQQPPGQSNLAVLTNPANPSFHPIQAIGKNTRIDPASFANGYDAQSTVYCSDCHSSDTPNMRGPHGSSYRYLLKKPSSTTIGRQMMLPNDICFDCHAFDVYGNASSSADVQRASRFNGGYGHAYHVGSQTVTCYTCHETHGSTRHVALIATRPGGIIIYAQTPNGGTCTTSCHSVATYSLRYTR